MYGVQGLLLGGLLGKGLVLSSASHPCTNLLSSYPVFRTLEVGCAQEKVCAVLGWLVIRFVRLITGTVGQNASSRLGIFRSSGWEFMQLF